MVASVESSVFSEDEIIKYRFDEGLHRDRRMAEDLYQRTRTGPIFYIVASAMTVLSDKSVFGSSIEAYIFPVFFTLLAVARLSQKRADVGRSSISKWWFKIWFLAFLGAAGWGIFFACIVANGALESATLIAIFCTVAFATACAYHFCVSRLICQICASLYIVPAMVVIALTRHDLLFLGGGLLIYQVYLVIAVKKLNSEYHARLNSEIALNKIQEELRELSLTDDLTGIANRRQYRTSLTNAYDAAMRANGNLSLVIVDIDHFKRINDEYGHDFGDKCLKHVADLLARYCRRGNDLVARIGGEEFAMLLSGTNSQEAQEFVSSIHKSLNVGQYSHRNTNINITASFGIATFDPQQDKSAEDLFRRADSMVYVAKAMGRNRIEAAPMSPFPDEEISVES